MKNGACSTDAGDTGHGRVIEVADPDADGEIGSETEAPIVTKVGGGAGFDGARKGEAEDGIGAEGPGPGLIVGEDVSDEVAGFLG